jgi:hypothetical protein
VSRFLTSPAASPLDKTLDSPCKDAGPAAGAVPWNAEAASSPEPANGSKTPASTPGPINGTDVHQPSPEHDPDELSVAEIVCSHGKLDPDKAGEMKRIDAV